MRAGSGGTSPTPLPGSARHAQPGSILYASRVNKMSLARARLDPASGSGWFGFRAVIWPARETVVRAGSGCREGAAPDLVEEIPTPLCTRDAREEENPSRCDHTHGQSAKRQPW